MSFTTWILLGIGAFIIYSGYKKINPFTWLVTLLGIKSAKPIALGGVS